MVSPHSDPHDDSLDLWQESVVFWRHRWVLVGFAVAVAGIASVLTLLQPPIYQATVTVVLTPGIFADSLEPSEVYRGLAESRFVLDTVGERLGVDPATVDLSVFRQRGSAAAEVNLYLLVLTARAGMPRLAKDAADMWARVFVEEQTKVAQSSLPARMAELNALQQRATNARADLDFIRQQHLQQRSATQAAIRQSLDRGLATARAALDAFDQEDFVMLALVDRFVTESEVSLGRLPSSDSIRQALSARGADDETVLALRARLAQSRVVGLGVAAAARTDAAAIERLTRTSRSEVQSADTPSGLAVGGLRAQVLTLQAAMNTLGETASDGERRLDEVAQAHAKEITDQLASLAEVEAAHAALDARIAEARRSGALDVKMATQEAEVPRITLPRPTVRNALAAGLMALLMAMLMVWANAHLREAAHRAIGGESQRRADV